MTSFDIPVTPLRSKNSSFVIPTDDTELMIVLNSMIKSKSREGIEKLFQNGLKIDINKIHDGYTLTLPIVTAIQTQDLEWIKEVVELFNKYSQPLNLTTMGGSDEFYYNRKPLWIACQISVKTDSTDIVEYLLSDLKLKPSQQEFLDVLIYLYEYTGHNVRKLLKLCIRHGFDINFVGEYDQNILRSVVLGCREETECVYPDPVFARELIEEYGAKITPMIREIANEHKERIRDIVETIALIENN